MKQKAEGKAPLKVLYLEDSPKDIEIIRELLIDAKFDLSLDYTDKKEKFISLLNSNTYDVILSDFKLIGFDAFGALQLHNDICPKTPFICISGSIGEETAIELIKQGAVDYVLKDRMVRLPSAIKRALNEVKVREELHETEYRYRLLFNSSMDAVLLTSPKGEIFSANPAACKMFGRTEDEICSIGRDGIVDNSDPRLPHALEERSETGKFIGELLLKRNDGSKFLAEVSSALFKDREGRDRSSMVIRDITERKRVEQALRDSKHMLQIVLDSIPAAVFWKNKDLLYLGGNYNFLKAAGLKSSDEIIGISDYDLSWEKGQADAFREHDKKIIDSGVPEYGIIEPFLRADGIQAWARTNKLPLRDADGNIIGVLGTYEDITEQKQAEEALYESEKNYKELIDAMNDTVWVVDYEGNVIDVNKTALEVLGYSKDELLKVGIFGVDSSLKRENIKALAESMPTDKIQIFETSHRMKNGRVFPVEVSSTLVTYKGQKAILSIARDITERKRAEEALRESELRFRSLYENATIGLYRTTLEGKILLANTVLVKMLGYESFEKLAERNLEREGFESHSPRSEFIEKIKKDGKVVGYESKWIHKNGKIIFVRESASAIRDSYGNTVFYDGTVEDITERKMFEEQFRQIQKLEGLGTLAGGIAHDFNNILGIILAYITNLKRIKDDSKKLDVATNTIEKAVQRGKTLVRQILTFARKTEINFGPVNVNDVVMEIMGMILETFPKVISYTQNFDKNVPFIDADRSQIHQALLNLCVNARDAMPSGGVLTINTRLVSAASLKDKHADLYEKKYVCIEVIDNGVGMSEDVMKRIFEPFFTTKEIGKGTGLGLAVVFGIVQTHKGFIDFESEPSKGTTFRLYLPALLTTTLKKGKEEEKLEEIKGGTETLLVVEDEEALLEPLQMLLAEKGYKVFVAQDGYMALDIYKEHGKEIALVITDLGLPKMSGLEVCRQIKKINTARRIILATGYLDPEMKEEFSKSGIDKFLFKPYEMVEVLKIIRQVLDGK